MLNEIRIKNFKSLKDSGNLEIKPITLLVGPNSSGKSSLIQFLLLLKQTMESRDIQNPLIFNGTCIQLESYQNIIFMNNLDLSLEFEFSFDDATFLRMPRFGRAKYRVVLNREEEKKEIKLLRFEIMPQDKDGERISIFWDKIKKRYEGRVGEEYIKHNIHFTHFCPSGFYFGGSEKQEKVSELLHRQFFRIRFFGRLFSEGINYLGPLREYPQRYYVVSGAIMEDVGFKGEKTIEVLTTSEKDILENVEKWIRRFGLADSIEINPLKARGTLVEVLLRYTFSKISFNLYDVGFGVSQVLPIIVEGFYAPKNSLILIEQPEIHLHPKLQSDVGDLLIEISKLKKLIVETHSEHLLLRIQRRITEGSLRSEDVAIYFFTYTPDGTTVKRIQVDDLGRFEGWPAGFFEEDTQESFAITRAFLRRKKEMGG